MLLMPWASTPPRTSLSVGRAFSDSMDAVDRSPISSTRATTHRIEMVTQVPASKAMPNCSGCGMRNQLSSSTGERSSLPKNALTMDMTTMAISAEARARKPLP